MQSIAGFLSPWLAPTRRSRKSRITAKQRTASFSRIARVGENDEVVVRDAVGLRTAAAPERELVEQASSRMLRYVADPLSLAHSTAPGTWLSRTARHTSLPFGGEPLDDKCEYGGAIATVSCLCEFVGGVTHSLFTRNEHHSDRNTC
jgi:hypothetical protein